MPSTFDYRTYWDNKFEYFLKNEGYDNISRKDIPNADDVLPLLELLDIQTGEAVLDIGCGIGRLFPFVLNKGASVVGVDVSPRMIEESQRLFSGDNNNVEARVMNAEILDFADETFNKIFCYAVFDGLECQSEALHEMIRVAKLGALILLSGKHKPYCDDDMEAQIAEEKAAAVGHPNYFTDWNWLVQELTVCGCSIKRQLFYERRGDMALKQYVGEPQEKFYEFVVLLQKEEK